MKFNDIGVVALSENVDFCKGEFLDFGYFLKLIFCNDFDCVSFGLCDVFCEVDIAPVALSDHSVDGNIMFLESLSLEVGFFCLHDLVNKSII